MAVKKNDTGRYIKKIGYLDLRAKDQFVRGTATGKFGRDKVGGTELNLYHEKKKVGGPYKNVAEASNAAIKIMGEKYCEIYNLPKYVY